MGKIAKQTKPYSNKIAKQTKPYSNIRNGWCKWNRYKMESQYPYPRRSYGHAEFFAECME